MENLPLDIQNRIRSELQSGERLIWAGQPIPKRLARMALPIVLFGIPWTAFAIFWVVMASGMIFGGFAQQAPNGIGGFMACFPLFGVPFILVGLAMLSSPYWIIRRAKQSCYALTNQRAILWQAGWWGSIEVRSYTPEQLGKITRRDYTDGSGDLIFEELITLNRSHNRTHSHLTNRGFLAIPNVREVDELLRKTLLVNQNG